MKNLYQVEINDEAKHLSYKNAKAIRAGNFEKVVAFQKAKLLNKNNIKQQKLEKQKQLDLIFAYFAKKVLPFDIQTKNGQFVFDNESVLDSGQKSSVSFFLEKRLKQLGLKNLSLTNEYLTANDLHLICNAMQECFNKLEKARDAFFASDNGNVEEQVGTIGLLGTNDKESSATFKKLQNKKNNADISGVGRDVGFGVLDDVMLLLAILCSSCWEIKIDSQTNKYSTFELLTIHGFSRNQIKESLKIIDVFVDSFCAFNWCSNLEMLSKRLGAQFGDKQKKFLENLLGSNSKLTGKLIETQMVVSEMYNNNFVIISNALFPVSDALDPPFIQNSSGMSYVIRVGAKDIIDSDKYATFLSIEALGLANKKSDDVNNFVGNKKYNHLPRMIELWCSNVKSLENLSKHKAVQEIMDNYVNEKDVKRLSTLKNKDSGDLNFKYCQFLMKNHALLDKWIILLTKMEILKYQSVDGVPTGAAVGGDVIPTGAAVVGDVIPTRAGVGGDSVPTEQVIKSGRIDGKSSVGGDEKWSEREKMSWLEIKKSLNEQKVLNMKHFKKMMFSLNLKDQQVYKHNFDFEHQDGINLINKSFLLSMLSSPTIMSLIENKSLTMSDDLVDFLLKNKKFSKRELYMINDASLEEKSAYFKEQLYLSSINSRIDFFLEKMLPSIRSSLEKQKLEKELGCSYSKNKHEKQKYADSFSVKKRGL